MSRCQPNLQARRTCVDSAEVVSLSTATQKNYCALEQGHKNSRYPRVNLRRLALAGNLGALGQFRSRNFITEIKHGSTNHRSLSGLLSPQIAYRVL